MKKNILKILTYFLISLFLFFSISPAPVVADVFDEMRSKLVEFGTGAQLPSHPSGDILPIIINIINILLTFLALLFIIMILYAGFLYLTAGGTPDKVKKAQSILKDSIIGVAIVVLAGVFVNYILEAIINAVR